MALVDWTGAPLDKAPQQIKPSACAAIFDAGGRLLLMKRSDNGHWCLPGGGVEIGESVGQAAVREAFEETGLRVHARRLVGVYSDPAYYSVARYPDGNTVQYVSVLFECEITGGELRGSEEDEGLGFFAPDQLPEPLLWSHRIRIADLLSGATEAFAR
jgi:ADP-ribose pyrophosphatase YjhB (NUDIX family)